MESWGVPLRPGAHTNLACCQHSAKAAGTPAKPRPLAITTAEVHKVANGAAWGLACSEVGALEKQARSEAPS